MTTVFIRGVEFYAHHGVSDEEQATGRRYRLSLGMEVTFGGSDAVSDTVDYGEAAVLAIEVATAEKCRLVETVAERIASALLERFPTVQSVQLELEKLHPPMPLVCESAGVVIERFREDMSRPR